MGRFVPLVYGVLSAIYLLGVAAQDIPDCIPQCSNQLRGEFPKFSCQSAEDAACLCGKIDFFYGVRDCAAPCGSTNEFVRKYLSGAFCQGQALPALPSSSPPSPKSSQSTSKPSDSKSAAAEVSSSPPPTSPEQASSTAQENSSTAISSSIERAQATSDSSSSVSASSTSAAAVANAATSSAAAGGGSSGSSGLSRGAAAGIGVGAGIGGIALALLAFGLFLKCRRRKTDKPVDISKPLPRGATKANGAPQIASDRPVGDIEMTSTRYEDMVPRQQPRTMI